jgi:glucosamine--fructose-6-phosphate aminotransferase (isomerizing)
MLKEIYEQPEAVRETIGDRVRHGELVLERLGLTERDQEPAPHRHRRVRHRLPRRRRRALHHRGVGAHPRRAGHRQRVDLPQSGSVTRHAGDRHLAIRGDARHGQRDEARAREGRRTLAITNLMGTQITREADAVLYTRCGLEVGVAASKTFTAQVALLSLLALRLAQVKKTLPDDELTFIVDHLYELPGEDPRVPRRRPSDRGDRAALLRQAVLPLPRPPHRLPVALEGALKLKEISYIPTEAYSAGEMKHGPIALLEEGTPVVVVATNIHVYDKIVSNIQETRARGAHVIAIATDGNEDIQHHADDVIYVPRTPTSCRRCSRSAAAAARLPDRALRGLNVDQPRNLAKTVTVE